MEAKETQTEKKRGAPPDIIELIDVAIYTFCCMAGITQQDKVRGNPVLHGVVAIFFQMLKAAKESTKAAFIQFDGTSSITNPGKLQTVISSRLKFAKKNSIKAEMLPSTPEVLYETEETVNEDQERIDVTCHPRCWRCKEKCRRCQMKPDEKGRMIHFRSELMSPVLDVFDQEFDIESSASSSDEESSEGLPEDANDDDVKSLMENFFEEDFTSEEEDNSDGSRGVDTEMVNDTESEDD